MTWRADLEQQGVQIIPINLCVSIAFIDEGSSSNFLISPLCYLLNSRNKFCFI